MGYTSLYKEHVRLRVKRESESAASEDRRHAPASLGHFLYRLIREIFVPSILTPAISPCWLKIKA
jgi:hypothetical protein